MSWIADHLFVPDGADAGDPFVPTRLQADWLRKFYALDAAGWRKTRRSALVWPKGEGKSPIAAAAAAAEAWGPPAAYTPEIQIAAVSQDATRNTWDALQAMIVAPDGRVTVPGDVGMTRIILPSGGRVYPVTASAGTRRGQRLTFAVMDESSLWVKSNGGRALAQTIRDNLSKMGGFSVETTNVWVEGAGSVAESTYESSGSDGVLVSMPTAPGPIPDDLSDMDRVREILEFHHEFAPWLDVDRLMDDAGDADVDAPNFLRNFCNVIVPESDAWVSRSAWEQLADPGEAKLVVGERVAAGFDGGRMEDSTAIVVAALDRPVMVLWGIWERPDDRSIPWEAPVPSIDASVEDLHAQFDVARMYADPPFWQDEVDSWSARYGDVMRWETYRGRQMASAVDRLDTAIRTGGLSHDGSEPLARHMLNARYDTTRHGKRLRKDFPKSRDKIDAAVAAVLAWEARGDALVADEQKPKGRRKRRGTIQLVH